MSLPSFHLFSDLASMVSSVTEVNGSNDKISRLQNYPQLKPFLKIFMNPLETTGVTRKLIEKYSKKRKSSPSKSKSVSSKKCKLNSKRSAKKKKEKGEKSDLAVVALPPPPSSSSSPLLPPPPLPHSTNKVSPTPPPLFTNDLVILVQRLQSRQYSGHEAYEAVLHMVNLYPEYEDLILNVADGNLKLRMGVTQINKAFPGLIVDFSTALAKKFELYEKKFHESLKKGTRWYISRKYDGVRCLTVCLPATDTSPVSVKCYSREGKYFPAMVEMYPLLAPHITFPMVLDGEICVMDEKTGEENFRAAVSSIKRKSVIMKNFKYCVFDIIDKKDFDAKSSKKIFSQRQKELEEFLKKVNSSQLYQATQTLYSEVEFETLLNRANAQGWEGLMLRKDMEYEGKRTNSILKCKKFEREEFVVCGTENKVIRFIDNKTGLENPVETLGSVSINYKGNIVKVGSGFSKEERDRFYRDPSLIVGKTISVQYFEETPVDKNGKVSLRFPTFKCVYGEKRSV